MFFKELKKFYDPSGALIGEMLVESFFYIIQNHTGMIHYNISNFEINKKKLAEELKEHFVSNYVRFKRTENIANDIGEIELIFQHLNIDIENKEISINYDFELALFEILLETPLPGSKLFRYSYLESVFTSIYSESFTFSGIVGMNDTTEVDYVENYLFNESILDKKKHWRHIKALNNKYIMSCTSLEDDLTFWRLYGDDFKGAYLEYILVERKNDFIIKKVNYAEKNGGDKILDLIKELHEFSSLKGFKFLLKNIEIWKHFFKPYDYAVEKEIRILYLGNGDMIDRKWCLTHSHKILNPITYIKMEKTPLLLKKICLGRKHNAYLTNEYQFKELLREKKLNEKVEVCISKINNYR